MAGEKSTVDEIRRRFDADVERFSDLNTGQAATLDAMLVLELIAQAAVAVTPNATAVLDVGCGAGNYTLRLLRERPGLDCTLLDLSRPMLDRAVSRVTDAGGRGVTAVQADVREADFPDGSFDVILAAQTLHHLRSGDEFDAVFAAFFRWLRPGGSVWVADSVEHAIPDVGRLMQRRWGEFLSATGGDDYRDKVLAYVEREDTPRPLVEQLDRLRASGFGPVDVLHANGRFAAFGGVRPVG